MFLLLGATAISSVHTPETMLAAASCSGPITGRQGVPGEPRLGPRPLSFTSLQTSSWAGAWGQDQGSSHSPGAQGTLEHLFQPPLLTEEGLGPRKGEFKVTSRRW